MRKNKYIALLAAFMITAVFFTPITAYANSDGETAVNNSDQTAVDNPDETDEEISINFNELPEMSATDEPPNESAVPDISKPFTPDGQASVVDLAYESDGKMFYTFKTPASNVFYLIIDRERGMDNVYFLNAATENDLLALAENAGTNNANESAIPTTNPNGNGGTSEKPDAEDETPPPSKKATTLCLFFF